MLPQDKYKKVQELMKNGEVVSFVGDGKMMLQHLLLAI